MPDVSSTVSLSSFDPTLVGLSFLIAVFGAWCGLSCAVRARRRTGLAATGWLLAAAAAVGGGAIWSMHFIGMLAYRSEVLYRLNLEYTVVSLAAAVLAAALALVIANRYRSWVGYVLGGVVLGTGVGVMHYLGMAAMEMSASMRYRMDYVTASLVIGVVASTVAVVLTLNATRAAVRGAAAFVMGVGVCAMHYTGMAGLTVAPHLGHHDLSVTGTGTDPFSLAMPIFGVTAVLLFVLLFAGLFDDTPYEPEVDPAAQPAA